MKAPFSDIHLRFSRKKCRFDHSDSIIFFKPYLELGIQMQEPSYIFPPTGVYFYSVYSTKIFFLLLNVLHFSRAVSSSENSSDELYKSRASHSILTCGVSNLITEWWIISRTTSSSNRRRCSCRSSNSNNDNHSRRWYIVGRE